MIPLKYETNIIAINQQIRIIQTIDENPYTLINIHEYANEIISIFFHKIKEHTFR